jgi:hypothetical protein
MRLKKYKGQGIKMYSRNRGSQNEGMRARTKLRSQMTDFNNGKFNS